MSTEVSNYSMGSLYVDNLHPDVTEAMLFNKFVTTGRVISIDVCRDAMTNQSLGCAYINYQEPADAELAINTMNSDLLLDCPLRIIWSRRKSSLVGKLIIRNLDKSIKSKTLYDIFRTFGNISSCNVMIDENGQSKGFGFVSFETQETADEAIDKINGMLLGNQKISVIRFVPREQRKYTNIFIQNYDDQLDEDQLRELISKHGKISNFKFETDENGHSQGFAFCSFENPEEAEAVIQNLNGYSIGDKQLYVALAQSKEKRCIQSQQPTALENETSQKQKQMLGERLFPLVQQMQPELAGKLTGMLLELDNTELLHMLESQEVLKAKVEEAIIVLQAKQLEPMVHNRK